MAEIDNAGPGGGKADEWRWIEYGPDGRIRKLLYDGPVRTALEGMGLVGEGTGSTWHSLARRGLLSTDHRPTGIGNLQSLFIRLTTDGRRAARLIKGLPMLKPKVDNSGKPLSLIALRLLQFGQDHPEEDFDSFGPWDGKGRSPEPLIILAIARGLVSKGLLETDRRKARFRITPAGLEVDVQGAENWKPLGKPPAEGHG